MAAVTVTDAERRTLVASDSMYFSSEEIPRRKKRQDPDWLTALAEESEPEGDTDESPLKAETALQDGKFGRGESSATKKEEQPRRSSGAEPEGEQGTPGLTGWTRSDRIVAILLRAETGKFLGVLESQGSSAVDAVAIQRFIVESRENLHTFGDLVSEDLVSVSENRLFLTPLAERFIEQMAFLE